MRRHITTLAVLTQLAAAFNCSIEPLYVDIHKRAVHGTPVFQWGSFIGIGSPAQNQSVWPSLTQNETTFAGSNFCASSNVTNCPDATGGHFNIEDSTTWTSTNNASIQMANGNNYVGGKDRLHMYTHFFQTDGAWETNLDDTEVAIAQSGNSNPGVNGMGSSSTLLKKMVDIGLIVGRTYSLYLGTGFDRAGGAAPGSNMFGGYDSARFVEPVHTYPMDLSNKDYLPVTVADIIIDDPELGKISAMIEDQNFTARITTDRYPMKLPYQVTRNLLMTLGGAPANSSDGSIRLARPFNGTVTIKLGDGFNVTLPAATMFNASGLAPIENTAPDYNGPFYLSSSFLTEVYLMMDFEFKQFHLAQAVQFAPYIVPRTLCPGSTPISHGLNRQSLSKFSRAGLSGVIVGSVIGGLFLIVLSWVGFTYWKRSRIQKEQEERWAMEEKAAELKREDVEMQAMSPASDYSNGTYVHAPQPTYAPIRTGGVDEIGMDRGITGSPVSEMSRMSSVSSGSRPASLREGRL